MIFAAWQYINLVKAWNKPIEVVLIDSDIFFKNFGVFFKSFFVFDSFSVIRLICQQSQIITVNIFPKQAPVGPYGHTWGIDLIDEVIMM